MTATPRTDALEFPATLDNGARAMVTSASFSREIEQLCNAYAETLGQIVSLAVAWQGGTSAFVSERDFVAAAIAARNRHPGLAL